MKILKEMLGPELSFLAKNGLESSWEDDNDQLWPIVEKISLIKNRSFKKLRWTYPVFLCNEWAQVDGMNRYYDESHDRKLIASKKDTEKQFDYYSSLNYSDLKNMLEDFEKSIRFQIKHILRRLDILLSYHRGGRKEELVFEILHWCLGSFNGWVMYKIDTEFLTTEDEKDEVKEICDKLNSAREKACKNNYKIILIGEVLNGKRTFGQLNFSDLILVQSFDQNSGLFQDESVKNVTDDRLKPRKEIIYKRYGKLRGSVREAFYKLKDELESEGWDPEEYGLRDEPYHFNRAYTKYLNKKNDENQSSQE